MKVDTEPVKFVHDSLTAAVIGFAYDVANTRELTDIHLAQCLNYLKATGLKTCLLINFGKPHIDIKRISL